MGKRKKNIYDKFTKFPVLDSIQDCALYSWKTVPSIKVTHLLLYFRKYDNQNLGTFIMYESKDGHNNLLQVCLATACTKLGIAFYAEEKYTCMF